MNPAQGVTVRSGVIVALLAGIPSLLALSLARRAGAELAGLTWWGLVPLVLFAGLVLVLSWQVRRYVRRGAQGSVHRVLSPQRGRATLVGAQAAALGGAALLGWYLAIAVLQVPNVDVPSVREQFLWALGHGVAALGLSVAGYVGQWWCRLPPEDSDGEDGEGDLAFG